MDGVDESIYYFDMNWEGIRFRIHMGDKSHCPVDWRWDHEPEPGKGRSFCFNLWLIAEGRGTLQEQDRNYSLSAGDCFLLRMDQPHRGRHETKNPLFVPWIVFEMRDEDGKPWMPDEKAFPRYRKWTDMSFLLELLDRFFEVYDSRRPENPEAEQWLRVILMEILRQDRLFASPQPMAKVDGICNEIRQRPGERYLVRELATRLHCTIDHFIRLFRAHRGVTPGEFIIQCRIQAAQNLLSSSSMTISQIADHLGYCNPFFFSKQFRKQTGLSPRVFRARGTGREKPRLPKSKKEAA